MSEVKEGIWRHYKGQLYQVLFTATLTHPHPANRTLFHARWSSNGPYEGRDMAVEVALWEGNRMEIVASPVGLGPWVPGGLTGVVYIGLELAGNPAPGLRPRVRDLHEFTGTVITGGGEVPRFTFTATRWAPGL